MGREIELVKAYQTIVNYYESVVWELEGRIEELEGQIQEMRFCPVGGENDRLEETAEEQAIQVPQPAPCNPERRVQVDLGEGDLF